MGSTDLLPDLGATFLISGALLFLVVEPLVRVYGPPPDMHGREVAHAVVAILTGLLLTSRWGGFAPSFVAAVSVQFVWLLVHIAYDRLVAPYVDRIAPYDEAHYYTFAAVRRRARLIAAALVGPGLAYYGFGVLTGVYDPPLAVGIVFLIPFLLIAFLSEMLGRKWGIFYFNLTVLQLAWVHFLLAGFVIIVFTADAPAEEAALIKPLVIVVQFVLWLVHVRYFRLQHFPPAT